MIDPAPDGPIREYLEARFEQTLCDLDGARLRKNFAAVKALALDLDKIRDRLDKLPPAEKAKTPDELIAEWVEEVRGMPQGLQDKLLRELRKAIGGGRLRVVGE